MGELGLGTSDGVLGALDILLERPRCKERRKDRAWEGEVGGCGFEVPVGLFDGEELLKFLSRVV